MKIIRGTTKVAPKLIIHGLPGCIDGEAKIMFRSSLFKNREQTKKIKLKILHKRFNGEVYRGWGHNHKDETIEVRCLNELTGRPEWVAVKNVIYSGVKEVLKISAEKFEVMATPDHKFWTADGWKELRDISVGDMVGVFTIPTKRTGKRQVRNKEVIVKYHPTAPHKVVNGCEYCRLSEHRLAYEAYANGMTPEEYRNLLNNYDGRPIETIPKGVEVHHINGDHYDNRPENMELLSKSDHAIKGVKQSIRNLQGTASVLFVRVTEITNMGERPTYDISCADPFHSFTANNFIVHNCGKSTLATKLKNPIFLDFEGGLSYIDCARTPQISDDEVFSSYLIELHNAAKAGKREFDTVVIDSIDWAMRLLEEQAAGIRVRDPKTGQVTKNLTATLNKANGGYGNGPQLLVNLVRSQLIPRLSMLSNDGYGVCLIAHSTRKTVMSGDGIDIDRIAPKIHDKVFDVFNEWADDIFYLRNDNGERYLVLEGDDNILAKNRQSHTGEVRLADVDINELLQPKKGDK